MASYQPTPDTFLASQIQWKSSVSGMAGMKTGTMMDPMLLIDWLPWMMPNSDIANQINRAAGLLHQPPWERPELRLLPCAAYLKETIRRNFGDIEVRYALAYQLPAQTLPPVSITTTARPRTRSLRKLMLNSAKHGLQPPLLETRINLARSLCRAMLLYLSSGWVHHDFRSHNVLFTHDVTDTPGTGATDADAAIYAGVPMHKHYIIGFGYARDEENLSVPLADPNPATNPTLRQRRLYWAPSYLESSAQMRRVASFQRIHNVYSLGCVMLELGVWRPLESYTWQARYDNDHALWHRRLLQEIPKLGVMCGTRYAEAVRTCLLYGGGDSHDVRGDVQGLAFDVLLALEEIVV